MTERQNGFLWRLARLHPAWMVLPFFCIFALIAVAVQLAGRGSESGEAGALAFVLMTLVQLMAYAFLVLYAYLVSAMVSGRFHSRRPRRLFGPNLALIFIVAILLAALMILFASLDGVPLIPDDADSWLGALASFAAAVVVMAAFYLVIRACLDLVEAERGFGGGTGRKIGAFILFIFWFFGFFFIQARIRRLALKFDAGGVASLPTEKLELREVPSGNLSLLLTERVSVQDFDAYGEELIQRLDGHILKKSGPSDGLCWDVEIEGSDFQLAFDSSLGCVSLESHGDSAELLLDRLRKWLVQEA